MEKHLTDDLGIIENLKNQLNNLKKNYTQLKHILSMSPGHIYWKNKNGVYLGCNDAQAISFGFSNSNEVVGKTDYDWLPKIEADNIHNIDQNIIHTEETVIIEEPSTTADGKESLFLSKKIPLRDDLGNVVGVIGISFDITDKKNAEQLKIEKSDAEKKTHYTKMAAGSIAHDLRTPLASLYAMMAGIEPIIEKLMESYDIASEENLTVPFIPKSKLESMQTVINRGKKEVLFSNSYIDMILGNLKYDNINTDDYKTYAIKTVINDALETYPYQDDEKKLLHVDFQKNFDFFGNDFYLKNIMNNLLKNAFYYIKKNRRGEIFVTMSENGKNNLLKFKDTAQGVSEDVLKHMFDGYFSKREGGTGLGLAFCKSIMESFGGSVFANSIEGEFIEFTLIFPKEKRTE